MSGIMNPLVTSILALTLLSQGAPQQPPLIPGAQGGTIAGLQASLDALGLNAGTVTGVVNLQTLTAAGSYVTQFPVTKHQPLATAAAQSVKRLPPFSSTASGSAIGAVETWLRAWRLYAGPLHARGTPELQTAVSRFQQAVGLPATGVLSGLTLATMAHLAAVRVVYRRRWRYSAAAGDTITALAFATGLSLQRLESANPAHGTWLWTGQAIHWTPVVPANPSPSKSTAPSPAAVPSSATYSNLNPVAALVIVNPSAGVARSLLTAEARTRGLHALPDVALSGEWVLNHPGLAVTLAHAGNEVDTIGYSGTNLNRLPVWGVRQELGWAIKVFSSQLGQTPEFLLTPRQPSAAVQSTAAAAALATITPGVDAPAGASTRQLLSLLLGHNRAIVVTTGGAIKWPQLFASLAARRFVFLNLGQIWAGQP
ncbi:MAG: peptidoglycan-binding protein [Thermaerobacter sp.]|nr:peptidoglycan-binding protein [Thermaerobacter sp.]